MDLDKNIEKAKISSETPSFHNFKEFDACAHDREVELEEHRQRD
jgi:hypothetical protein